MVSSMRLRNSGRNALRSSAIFSALVAELSAIERALETFQRYAQHLRTPPDADRP